MAKAKALPKGVLDSRQMLSKINKEPDSLGLVLLYGTESYMIDGAVSMLKKAFLGEGAEDMDYAVVDTRTGDLENNTRSDTILIASINNSTKEVKLVSVYRDTYLNLGYYAGTRVSSPALSSSCVSGVGAISTSRALGL